MGQLWDELNTSFYEKESSTYLRTRVGLLLALVDEGQPIADALRNGVRHADVRLRSVEVDKADRDAYLAIEAEVLAYAAAENLMRHFCAHANLGPCPWVELTDLDPRTFRKFCKKIEGMSENDVTALARPVFRGGPDRGTDTELDRWDEDGRALTRLLKMAASRVTDRAAINNALKHGLAVMHRTPRFILGKETDPAGVILDLAGSAILLLRRTTARQTAPTWHEVTEFVAPDTCLRFVAIVLDQLDSVHAVARARYLEDRSGKVMLLSKEIVDLTATMPTGTKMTGLMNFSFSRQLDITKT